MGYDPSSASSNPHRLGLPKLYMLTLDLRLRYAVLSFTSGRGNAILVTWERTAHRAHNRSSLKRGT